MKDSCATTTAMVTLLPYFVTGLGGNGRYGFGMPVERQPGALQRQLWHDGRRSSPTGITFEFWSIAGGGTLDRQLHDRLLPSRSELGHVRPTSSGRSSRGSDVRQQRTTPGRPSARPSLASLPVDDLLFGIGWIYLRNSSPGSTSVSDRTFKSPAQIRVAHRRR